MIRPFNILIAEDEALERKVLRHLLEVSDLPVGEILEASGGREALRLALEKRPDIIVLDIRMPGMDGLEAARLIREQLPESPIVIITAYDQFNYSQKAIKIGVADFLLKPVQPEELYHALRGTIQRLQVFPANSLPPENIPVVPPEVRDIADNIISKAPGQASAAWERLVDTWLKSLPERPDKAHARWFAWEVLVIVCQDLQGKSLPAGSVNQLKSEQGQLIRDIAGVEALRRWGLQLVEEIEGLNRKHISFDQAVIHRVQQYIKENYSGEISLTLLADMVHLNQAYLSRLFKQKAGMSFTDYLTRVRLQEAKRLLGATNQTIDEIAAAVGFKNNSYFTSVFKKREGINPSEFRGRQ